MEIATILLLIIVIVLVFGDSGRAFIKYALVFLLFLIMFSG